jgi:hypothetical protein
MLKKRQPLQQMVLEKLDTHIWKNETKLHRLSLCININSKWITDLSVRPKTLKLPQQRIGKTLEYIDIGNTFLSRPSITQQLRE